MSDEKITIKKRHDDNRHYIMRKSTWKYDIYLKDDGTWHGYMGPNAGTYFADKKSAEEYLARYVSGYTYRVDKNMLGWWIGRQKSEWRKIEYEYLTNENEWTVLDQPSFGNLYFSSKESAELALKESFAKEKDTVVEKDEEERIRLESFYSGKAGALDEFGEYAKHQAGIEFANGRDEIAQVLRNVYLKAKNDADKARSKQREFEPKFSGGL